MTALDDLVREYAERFEVDPDALGTSVRRALVRRQARASRPFKPCASCGRHRAARDFDGDARAADGLATVCKECRRARQRKRTQPHSEPWTCANDGCLCATEPQCVAKWEASYRCRHGHAPEHDLLTVYPAGDESL